MVGSLNAQMELNGNSIGISLENALKPFSNASIERNEEGEWYPVVEGFSIPKGFSLIQFTHLVGLNQYRLVVDGNIHATLKYNHQYFNHINPAGFVKNQWVIFEYPNDYQIFDSNKEEVLSGRSDSINISQLPRGQYLIRVNNIEEKFFKNKAIQ